MTDAEAITPRLVVTEPASMFGQGFALDSEQLTIGRAIENDVRIDDPHVSRRHAVIRRVNGEVVIEDSASSGGIIVNQKRVTKARVLRVGDRVRLGSVELEMRDPSAPPPAWGRAHSDVPAQSPSDNTSPPRAVLCIGLALFVSGLIAGVGGYVKWAAPVLNCIKHGMDGGAAGGSCTAPAALLIVAGGGLLMTLGAVLAVVGLFMRRSFRREQRRL